MSVSRIAGVTLRNRRRDRRSDVPPIHVEFDGQTVTTRDWTLGGVCLSPYRGRCLPGDRLSLLIFASVGERTVRHRVEAEVVRVDRVSEELAAQFVRLDAAAVDTLEGLLTGRLRRMRTKKP